MATSSITENIRVNDSTVLKEYVDAMERYASRKHARTEDEKSGMVTDPLRAKKFMAKVLAKKRTDA